MKHYLGLIAILITICLTSCIPFKDRVYLQNKSDGLDTLKVITEVQKPYRVQINDILNVRVKALDQDNVQIFNPIGDAGLNATGEERAYFDGFTVDLHGNIRIPTLGEINVLGYTAKEIEEMLEKKMLDELFKETANIFVTVKLAGLRFTVTGEVEGPGPKVIFRERVNIYEALAMSGEIPDTGNKRDVLIIRQYPQGQKIHHIDLTDIEAMKSPYYFIQPNDMIYVKPLPQKAWGTGTNLLQNIGAVATVLSLITTSILLINRF